jgi:hypothetical protein
LKRQEATPTSKNAHSSTSKCVAAVCKADAVLPGC